MSIEIGPARVTNSSEESGAPTLSELGRRIELRRLDRRLTKQQLARRAEISRQQLWRVMTGKSDITVALGARLSEVLDVDARWLVADTGARWPRGFSSGPDDRLAAPSEPPVRTLAELVDRPAVLASVLAALPTDESGRALKRSLLNAIEELASAAALTLPAHFFDLRREVVNGQR